MWGWPIGWEFNLTRVGVFARQFQWGQKRLRVGKLHGELFWSGTLDSQPGKKRNKDVSHVSDSKVVVGSRGTHPAEATEIVGVRTQVSYAIQKKSIPMKTLVRWNGVKRRSDYHSFMSLSRSPQSKHLITSSFMLSVTPSQALLVSPDTLRNILLTDAQNKSR